MKISIISFSRAGAQKNLELAAVLQKKNHQAASYSWHTYTGRKLIPFKSLGLLYADLWENQEVLLILADMEQALRAVAPQLARREKGPALVAVDEAGRFVIPLLPGKMKGLDDWCGWFAGLVGAVCVLTAKKEKEEIFSVDAFAGKNQLHIQDIFRIRTITESLAKGKPVGIYSDYVVEGVLPEGLIGTGKVMTGGQPEEGPALEDGISITDDWEAPHFVRECRMFPRNLVLGVTCASDTLQEEARQFILRVLAEAHISRERVCAVYSQKGEEEEAVLTALADSMGVAYFTYTKEQLAQDTVKMEPCEQCALTGSGRGRALVKYRAMEKMAVSVYEKEMELSF